VGRESEPDKKVAGVAPKARKKTPRKPGRQVSTSKCREKKGDFYEKRAAPAEENTKGGVLAQPSGAQKRGGCNDIRISNKQEERERLA